MRAPLLFCIILLLTACRGEETDRPAPAPPLPREQRCTDCHDQHLDPRHGTIACTGCHGGHAPALSADEAHAGLIRLPAHPDHMEQSCGPCHPKQVTGVHHSLHFTVKNKVNIIRRAFGAKEDLASLVAVPQQEEIASLAGLADDMLRRRCLRCHLYSSGDRYPETRRGTGCAACHLEFTGGKAVSHAFIGRPPDSQCLHCHYGNTVGADYHGRFEHDFHWDYRTPYGNSGDSLRPYGVEYHPLTPDVHQQAGMACIDCHFGPELMTGAPAPDCNDCHGWQQDQPLPATNLTEENGKLVLFTRHEGKKLVVPPTRHPAHAAWQDKADCAVCHAGWSFNDAGSHLLRLDVEEFDPWEALAVQGSSEVEKQITTSLYGDESLPYVAMTDTISNELYSGLWLMGYEQRRWEFPLVCADPAGVLHICRPLLDLHLSYVNEEEEVVYDAVTPPAAPPFGLLPYTPHTIGKAGAFYRSRLRENTFLLRRPLNLTGAQEEEKAP